MWINNKIRAFFSRALGHSDEEKLLACKTFASPLSKIHPPFLVSNSTIGDYSYIARNSNISQTRIGKFCSIGPNFMCGFGIHPTNLLSTSPMFYSTQKQNGRSFVDKDLVVERQEIVVGNDVFIGMNVVVLDGVNISDGAIIAAGAVVTENVEPYSIVGGVPAKIIRKRFSDSEISALCSIKWWDWEEHELIKVKDAMFEPEQFIKNNSNV